MDNIKIEAMLTSAYLNEPYGPFTNDAGKIIEGKRTGARFLVNGKIAKFKLTPDQVEKLLPLKNKEGTLLLQPGVFEENITLRYVDFEVA